LLTGYTLSTLATFHEINGALPQAGLIDVGGNLYGTTASGGSANDGTLFEYNTSTKSESVIGTFNGLGNGSTPSGGLIDVGGNFYGTTALGGTVNEGTVFEYNTSEKSLSTIAFFHGNDRSYPIPNGIEPNAGLIDVGGNLYGTTVFGGPLDDGTVFEYNFSTRLESTIAPFNGSNGVAPLADLTNLGGNLYGTTPDGGSAGLGTLFEYNSTTKTLSPLVNFNGSNGATPAAKLIDVGGNLYGTTTGAGSDNNGTVFEFNISTNELSTIATFNGGNGAGPFAGLIDVDGDLYGTTQTGGFANDGTVFELSQDAATPAISPGNGTYSGSVTVTIADATAGASIRFTTNGSTPTSTSTLYTGPFTVSDNETVKAVAFATRYAPSAAASVAYTIHA